MRVLHQRGGAAGRSVRSLSPLLARKGRAVVRLFDVASAVRVSLCFFALAALPGIILAQDPAPRPASPHSQNHTARSVAIDGRIAEGTYQNGFFAFTCKIPDGWIIQTKEFAEGTPDSPATHLLLSVLKHSPGTPDSSVNSAIVITAEDQTLYPDMVEAADYFVPLTEFTKSKGFEVTRKPYLVKIGAMDLDRADFRKDLGHLSMYQSTLVTIERGYVLSFTLIGSSEEEITGLIGGLSFETRTRTPVTKLPSK